MTEKVAPAPESNDDAVTAIVAPNTAPTASTPWGKWQVALETNHHYKKVITAVLLLFCFIDVLGTCLFMPAGPILAQQAPGGPIATYAQLLLLPPGAMDFKEAGLNDDFISLHESLAMDSIRTSLFTGTITEATATDNARVQAIDNLGNPRAFKEVPMRYSTAVNFLVMSGSLASGLGAAFWGWASDKVSPKACMIVCHFGGLAGYFIMWASGQHWNSYWGYFVGQVLNGLFSGAFTIVNSFFLRVFTKEEAEGPCGAVMGMSLLGGAVGSLILMPFISGRGENLFDSSWIGIGGTIISLIAITLLIHDGKKGGTAKEANRKQAETAKAKAPMPKTVQRILWICIIGGAVDAAGDEGTRIARGTVLQNTWPVTNDLMFQNTLLLSLLGLLFVVMALIAVFKKLIGLGATVVFGASATFITQLLLNYKIVEWKSYWGFLGMWFAGKLFGMMSSFGSMFIINDFAPEDAKGEWSGKLQGISGVFEACATMGIAILYDEQNDGSPEGLRGVTAMFLTAAISFCAIVAYSPLIAIVPRQIDEKALEKKFRTVEEYEALSDLDCRQLTFEEIDFLETKRMKDGKQPRVHRWGVYKEEMPELQGVMDRSMADFQWMKKALTKALVSTEAMEQDRQMWLQMQDFIAETYDLEKEAKEMGKWIADYFTDAGYMNWFQFPQMYKAMLMNAFPPIDPLDNKEVDFKNADLEHLYLKFLKVADSHVSHRNGQLTFLARLGLNQLRFTRS